VSVLHILGVLLQVYVILLIVRALLSWIPMRPGSPFATVVRLLDVVTEPVLRPVRRALPPIRAGDMAIDLSVLVVIIVGQVLAGILLSR